MTAPLALPPRVRLANLPTPLERLDRLGDRLGVELYVKRDDLTGAELSGNKVRKLEFLLADAEAAGADTLITCGGEQSNHCRATALAGVRRGFASRLLLRTADPSAPPPTEGNILLDRLAGADIRWISPADYARRAEVMAGEAERLRAAGRSPYVIPEGGSNPLGAWGYIAACAELADQLAGLDDRPTTIVYACGSGGTGAGLVLGVRMTGLDRRGVRVAGVNVCDDRDYFVRTIGAICAGVRERWPEAPAIGPGDVDIVDGYVGAGYARSRPAELELLRDVARAEGLVLDPVYTGKAMFGLASELARDRRRFGDRVVFLHTGGIFGLFPKAEQLAPLL
ncbi:MAG: D-cysteine desulfhydrase family protein [Deltaproteobacteria bacterium]|nr:MAG: D-cysteine desulfhydrase family protein [Deltaproteobacteria bacterium]